MQDSNQNGCLNCDAIRTLVHGPQRNSYFPLSGDVIVLNKKIGLFSLLAVSLSPWIPALGQGCVAAHSNQRVISELVQTQGDGGDSLFSIHNLTLNIGYRVFNSNKYFQ